MSISSLLTTEAPLSPTVPQVVPSSSSRHSNIQLTASSSRPQRRKSSMDIPNHNMALPVATKKRKREGEADMEVFKYILSLSGLMCSLALLQMGNFLKSNLKDQQWIQ